LPEAGRALGQAICGIQEAVRGDSPDGQGIVRPAGASRAPGVKEDDVSAQDSQEQAKRQVAMPRLSGPRFIRLLLLLLFLILLWWLFHVMSVYLDGHPRVVSTLFLSWRGV
jgi:hypothetical protein